MASKGRKRDAEAEIAHLAAGCDKRSFALKRRRVVLACKLFDDVIEPLHLKLQSLGKTDAIIDAKLKESNGSKRDAKAAAMATKSAPLCVAGFIPEDPIPMSVHTLGAFHSHIIRDRLLPALEKGALSSANLRSVERHIGGKKGFLELLEFATGLQSSYELRGRMRCYKVLIPWLQELSMERGRRCLDLDLQEPWCAKGLYIISGSTEVGVTITHKFNQKTAVIPWTQVPECQNLQELIVSSNFSEAIAALDLKAGTLSTRTLLAPFFESQVIDDGPCSRVTPVKLKRMGSRRSVVSEHPMVSAKSEPKSEPSHASLMQEQQTAMAAPVENHEHDDADATASAPVEPAEAMREALQRYGEASDAVPTSSDEAE